MSYRYIYWVEDKKWIRMKSIIQVQLKELKFVNTEAKFDQVIIQHCKYVQKQKLFHKMCILICGCEVVEVIVNKNKLGSNYLYNKVLLMGKKQDCKISQNLQFVFKQCTTVKQLSEAAIQIFNIVREIQQQQSRDIALNQTMPELYSQSSSLSSSSTNNISVWSMSQKNVSRSVLNAYKIIQQSYEKNKKQPQNIQNTNLNKEQYQKIIPQQSQGQNQSKQEQRQGQQEQGQNEEQDGEQNEEQNGEQNGQQNEQQNEQQQQEQNGQQQQNEQQQQEQNEQQQQEQQQQQQQGQGQGQGQKQGQVQVQHKDKDKDNDNDEVKDKNNDQNYQNYESRQPVINSQEQKQGQNQNKGLQQDQNGQVQQENESGNKINQEQLSQKINQQSNEVQENHQQQVDRQLKIVSITQQNTEGIKIQQQEHNNQQLQKEQVIQKHEKEEPLIQQQLPIQQLNQTNDIQRQEIQNIPIEEEQMQNQLQIQKDAQPGQPYVIKNQQQQQKQQTQLQQKPQQIHQKQQKQDRSNFNEDNQKLDNKPKQKDKRENTTPKEVKQNSKINLYQSMTYKNKNKYKKNPQNSNNSVVSKDQSCFSQPKKQALLLIQSQNSGIAEDRCRFTAKTPQVKHKLKNNHKILKNKSKKLPVKQIYSHMDILNSKNKQQFQRYKNIFQIEQKRKQKKNLHKKKDQQVIKKYNNIQVIWFDSRTVPNRSIYESLKTHFEKLNINIRQQQEVRYQVLIQIVNNIDTQYVIVFTNSNFKNITLNSFFPFVNCHHYFMYCGSTEFAQQNIKNYSFEENIQYTVSQRQFKTGLQSYVKNRYKYLSSMNML